MEQFVMKTGVWLMLLLSALNLDSHLMVYYNYGKTFFYFINVYQEQLLCLLECLEMIWSLLCYSV